MSIKGPSEDARLLARQAKAAAQEVRVEALRAVVTQLQVQVNSGRLKRTDLNHSDIYTAAGISKATYFRYLERTGDLGPAVRDLLSGPPPPAPPVRSTTDEPVVETPDMLITRLRGENTEAASQRLALMEQLAACKIYISALELDLKAKKQEIKSKNGIIQLERSKFRKLLSVANSQAEKLRAAGIDPAVIAADIVASAAMAGSTPAPSRADNVVPIGGRTMQEE